MLLVAVTTIAVPLWSTGSAADVQVASGWWSRSPVVVPTDGLRVGGNPTGESAVAAIRIWSTAGEVPTELRLKIASETNPQHVSINACPATGSWSPVAGGGWDDRPERDCATGALAGARSETELLFDLSGVRTIEGVADLVLFVPGGGFADIELATPDAGSVTFVPGAPPDEGAASEEVALPEPAPELDTAPVPAPAPADPGGLTLGPAVSPALPEPQPAPSAGSSPRPARPTTRPVVTPIRRAVESVDDVRDRLLAGLVFLDLGAVWWLLNRRRADAAPGRPRLSLHDDPTTVLALAATRTRARRDAPSLR